jgi:hypothetical protein
MMNQTNSYPESLIPHIHLPENERVLSYLKEMHPFHEIIVPFAAKKVNDDITPPDFIGRFAAMESLPANSKYVIYGTEALVHPETGIIFGFITGTSMIYRLPEPILKEIRESNIVNFRVARESGPGMDNLESNWGTSPSITEQLVEKCFAYYGQTTLRDEVVHLNFEVDRVRAAAAITQAAASGRHPHCVCSGRCALVCGGLRDEALLSAAHDNRATRPVTDWPLRGSALLIGPSPARGAPRSAPPGSSPPRLPPQRRSARRAPQPAPIQSCPIHSRSQ